MGWRHPFLIGCLLADHAVRSPRCVCKALRIDGLSAIGADAKRTFINAAKGCSHFAHPVPCGIAIASLLDPLQHRRTHPDCQGLAESFLFELCHSDTLSPNMHLVQKLLHV